MHAACQTYMTMGQLSAPQKARRQHVTAGEPDAANFSNRGILIVDFIRIATLPVMQTGHRS